MSMTYTLTEKGKQEAIRFIAECAAKRKEILDANKDTADETTLPDVQDIEDDLNFTGIDDAGEYYNGWGVTDHYDSDTPLTLAYGIDFVPV